MMQFDTSQNMKLGQQMKLSPRMIQSMEILQMPILALQERIDQELETNIALEVNEEQAASPAENDRETDIESREMVVGDTAADDFARLDSMESNYREAFDNEYSSGSFSGSRMAGERDGKMDAMASISARGERLAEQLLHQWTFAEVSEPIAKAGRIILEYLNDDGLLDHEDRVFYRYSESDHSFRARHMQAPGWMTDRYVDTLTDGPGLVWASGPTIPKVRITRSGDTLEVAVWMPGDVAPTTRITYQPATAAA